MPHLDDTAEVFETNKSTTIAREEEKHLFQRGMPKTKWFHPLQGREEGLEVITRRQMVDHECRQLVKVKDLIDSCRIEKRRVPAVKT